MATSSLMQHNMQPGALGTTSASSLPGSIATTQASATPSTGSSDSTVISANDFLTLLVTEMQNQDPTADTDPNEYINQLVQVNSLEQLIQMNQTLTTAFGTKTSAAVGTTASDTAGATPASAAIPTSGAAAPDASAASVLSATGSKVAAAHQAVYQDTYQAAGSAKGQNSQKLVEGISQFAGSSGSSAISGALRKARSVLSGNLGAPKGSPAAMRVARALDGQKKFP